MCNYLIKVIKLFFFLLLIANIAKAEPLLNFKSNDLEVQLSSETDGIFRLSLISLSKTKQISEPEILELKDPYRLVLDLPEFPSKSSKTMNVSSAFISSLRIGAHADKTRFVIDIKDDNFPEYQIIKDQKTNAVSLEFVFADKSSTQKKIKESKKEEEEFSDDSEDEDLVEEEEKESRPQVTVTPKTTSTSTTSSTTSTTLKIIQTTTTSSSSTSTTIPVLLKQELTTTTVTAPMAILKKEEANKSNAELKSIFFQITENTRLPAVTFEVPGLQSYALNKLTEELYELVLDNSYLKGKYLELPQFPPDSFKGFAVINATEDKTNHKVAVKIYVDEGTKLFTFYMNDQLWVKVGN